MNKAMVTAVRSPLKTVRARHVSVKAYRAFSYITWQKWFSFRIFYWGHMFLTTMTCWCDNAAGGKTRLFLYRTLSL